MIAWALLDRWAYHVFIGANLVLLVVDRILARRWAR